MAVLRQQNWLGQQRADVPHLRALESAISADFDLLAGNIWAGNRALVVRGFDITTSNAVGNPATTLQLNVASGVLLHPLASEHGTIFSVASDADTEILNSTNPNVSGGFTAGQTSYVGLDLRRSADDTTADLVMFLDANTLIETPKSVPLARLLKYKIVISTTDFNSTPNLVPLAKVTTNASNTVTVLEDCRPMAFRLGSGGSIPNRSNTFSWTSRLENTSGSIFTGGDKGIGSLKDWSDAIMTRLWELGGGQYWYSATSDRDVKIVYGNPVLSSTSDNFEWTLGSSTLEWKSLSISFGNSPVAYNTVIDGTIVLADNQCAYVDIDRTSVASLTMKKGDLITLGTPTIPGSRFIIAWRRGNDVFARDRSYEIGRSLPVATTSVFGTVKLKYTAVDPTQPTVLAMQTGGCYTNIADSGNVAAFVGTGNGTGAGFDGTGGGSLGPGLKGTGGASGGVGVKGLGTVNSAGGDFTGAGTGQGAIVRSSGSGAGLESVTTGSGSALRADATGGTGHGLLALAGGNGNGVVATGGGTGAGGAFTGGSSGAPGATGVGTVNNPGLKGTGHGTGAGVEGIASASNQPAFKATTGYADLPVIDRAGTIDIGTTNATTINICRTGQSVNIAGQANIDLLAVVTAADIASLTCGHLDMASNRIINVGTPTASTDGALAGASGPTVISFAALTTQAAPTTDYMHPWFSTVSTDSSERFTLMASSGTISKLYIFANTGPVTNAATFTVRKNGVDTTLTASMLAGTTTANNTSGGSAFTVAAGDRISVKMSQAGGTAPLGITISMLLTQAPSL